MRINRFDHGQAVQAGPFVLAFGLFAAPGLLGFASEPVAAWSAWTLSAIYLGLGLLKSRGSGIGLGTALLAAGLWTLLAPGILGFDLSKPAAFWVHTLAGFVALGGSYLAFQDSDDSGMQTS